MCTVEEELKVCRSNAAFWRKHQDNPRLERKLFEAFIEMECEKGCEGVVKYRNGKNLKDGVEIVNPEKMKRLDAAEVHRYMLNKSIALRKKQS